MDGVPLLIPAKQTIAQTSEKKVQLQVGKQLKEEIKIL
jgi:hypothetical protein